MKYIVLVSAATMIAMERNEHVVCIKQTEYDVLAQRALAHYFKDDKSELIQALAPYLAPRLQSTKSQTILEKLANQSESSQKKAKRKRSQSDDELHSYIKKVVAEAIQDAILEKQQKDTQEEAASTTECSKFKTLALTIGSGILSAGATALITLLSDRAGNKPPQ